MGTCVGILTTDQWLTCAGAFVQNGITAVAALGSSFVVISLTLAGVVLMKRLIALGKQR